MAELVRNYKGYNRCAFCGNEGWVYLRRFRKVTAKRHSKAKGNYDVSWHDQELAACGYCERGHHLHERWGGAWRYTPEEMDVSLDTADQNQLDESQRQAYARIKGMAMSFAERYKNLELTAEEKDVAEYL